MRQVVKMPDGVIRFKKNAIVDFLLHKASAGRKCDLNTLAMQQFTREDREEFAQLIGYSICGYHELSYVSDESAAEASRLAKLIEPEAGGCRDSGCAIHTGMGND